VEADFTLNENLPINEKNVLIKFLIKIKKFLFIYYLRKGGSALKNFFFY